MLSIRHLVGNSGSGIWKMLVLSSFWLSVIWLGISRIFSLSDSLESWCSELGLSAMLEFSSLKQSWWKQRESRLFSPLNTVVSPSLCQIPPSTEEVLVSVRFGIVRHSDHFSLRNFRSFGLLTASLTRSTLCLPLRRILLLCWRIWNPANKN